MKYPAELNDKTLVGEFYRALQQLGYKDPTFSGSSTTHESEINSILVGMGADKGLPEGFSLLEYAANNRPSRGEDDVLFKLWRTGLVAALHVLKRHDRRENPSRTDMNVTPPLAEELVTYYRKLRDYEPLLYASDPRYRDHFAHVLRVWMLGIVVVTSLSKPQSALRLSIPVTEDFSDEVFSMEERFAVYTVAALTHDMGYPIEKLFKVNKAVGEMFAAYGGLDLQNLEFAFSAPHHQMAQDTMKLIASKPRYHPVDSKKTIEEEVSAWLQDYEGITNLEGYEEVNEVHQKSLKISLRSQWKYFQKYARALERTQHGFLSTLLLQRKLLFFREGEFALEEDYFFALEEIRQFVIRREILRTVATHTCPDIYFMSLISTEAVLFFCDEIQDWGRPRFQQLYGGDRSVGVPGRVILTGYTENRVAWKTEVDARDSKEFAEIVFGISLNLYTRLRSAPDSRGREFAVSWICEAKKQELAAEFDYDTLVFRLDVKSSKTGTRKSGMELLDSCVTGMKSPEKCREEFVKEAQKLESP